MELLSQLVSIFVSDPLVALFPAALFVGGFFRYQKRELLVIGILWASYCGYELLMKARVLCSGECNIRIDLLLIHPLLWFLTVYALARALWMERKKI